MAYEQPSQGIANYLINESLVTSSAIFVDYAPEINDVPSNPDYITIVKMISGDSNPRWMRDEINIVIQIIGKSSQQLEAVKTHAYSVYNTLLGSYNIELNGYKYYRFTSNSGMPVLTDYLENLKPLYTMSFSFVREATEAEGNRELMS